MLPVPKTFETTFDEVPESVRSSQKGAMRPLGVLCVGLASVAAARAEGVSPGTNHWSMEPIRRPAVPTGANPIDALIGAALRREGIQPNPPATPLDLVRRLYFDLTGLPPSPAEIEAFVSDPAPDRYERMVDRLLMRVLIKIFFSLRLLI